MAGAPPPPPVCGGADRRGLSLLEALGSWLRGVRGHGRCVQGSGSGAGAPGAGGSRGVWCCVRGRQGHLCGVGGRSWTSGVGRGTWRAVRRLGLWDRRHVTAVASALPWAWAGSGCAPDALRRCAFCAPTVECRCVTPGCHVHGTGKRGVSGRERPQCRAAASVPRRPSPFRGPFHRPPLAWARRRAFGYWTVFE